MDCTLSIPSTLYQSMHILLKFYVDISCRLLSNNILVYSTQAPYYIL